MTYTDTQLKQALAKMLPDLLVLYDDTLECRLLLDSVAARNTELLRLCWLAEETLDKQINPGRMSARCQHAESLEVVCGVLGAVHASWQQRVIALCKVKGVEIV